MHRGMKAPNSALVEVPRFPSISFLPIFWLQRMLQRAQVRACQPSSRLPNTTPGIVFGARVFPPKVSQIGDGCGGSVFVTREGGLYSLTGACIQLIPVGRVLVGPTADCRIRHHTGVATASM